MAGGDLTVAADATRGGPLIAAHGLGLRLGDVVILDGVSMTVHDGEIVTIVGPNGGGKSMLARAMLGLVPVDRGRIDRRPGLRVGYVPQRFTPDPVMPLSVSRFLSLTVRCTRADKCAALAEVGAESLIDRALTALSGGELRRVLIARAVLRRPNLLVLDEPVAGVDVPSQPTIYAVLRRLARERGIGILLISHDMHLVMASTNRVVCLNRHVCCAGEPEDVQRHPEYRALFGDTVLDGLAVYSHHHDHRHDDAGNVVRLPDGHRHGENPPHG